MKKAVIYCRVSTRKQKQVWNSLKTQEQGCRLYCKNNNISVSKIFNVDFTWTTAERPALNEMFDYISKNKWKITHCIIKHIDRNTRWGVEIHNKIKNKLHSLGVNLKDTHWVIQEKIKVIDRCEMCL